MKCAVCRTDTLQPTTLATNLRAYACATCEGVWITAADYWAWRDQQGADLPERPAPDPTPLPPEPSQAKVCPTCGHLLMPYRIGHDIPFTLDHCGHCNGV